MASPPRAASADAGETKVAGAVEEPAGRYGQHDDCWLCRIHFQNEGPEYRTLVCRREGMRWRLLWRSSLPEELRPPVKTLKAFPLERQVRYVIDFTVDPLTGEQGLVLPLARRFCTAGRRGDLPRVESSVYPELGATYHQKIAQTTGPI